KGLAQGRSLRFAPRNRFPTRRPGAGLPRTDRPLPIRQARHSHPAPSESTEVLSGEWKWFQAGGLARLGGESSKGTWPTRRSRCCWQSPKGAIELQPAEKCRDKFAVRITP